MSWPLVAGECGITARLDGFFTVSRPQNFTEPTDLPSLLASSKSVLLVLVVIVS